MSVGAILFDWDGEAMVPRPPFRKKCDEQFVVGEIYRLEPFEHRSRNSHNHYFAALHDAWLNLPEDTAIATPTAEHLRKWALIRTGYSDVSKFAAATPKDAVELAATLRNRDDFAVVTVSENIVTEYRAKSQSQKAMGKEDFQKSKSDVLDYVAGLLGTTAEDLKNNARNVA